MKKLILLLLGLYLMPSLVLGQNTEDDGGIQWWSENEVVNDLIDDAIGHLMNIEREKAFTLFEKAVELDPSLFAPHVAMGTLTWGEMRDKHKAMAKELVGGKNMTSQLYVSLLDVEPGPDAGRKRHEIWAKMHKLSPGGPFIHFNYARTKGSNQEVMDALTDMLANAPDNFKTMLEGPTHNLLGYMNYYEGNKSKAREHFEKYLELYPDGYNSYDSMAEFYANEGMDWLALEYYRKAHQRYPGANSAMQGMRDLREKMRENQQFIQWTGEDAQANAMVWRGIQHVQNAEFEKALTFFEASLELDPSLFAPHVALSWFTQDEVSAMHKKKAKELVADKNETSKMFVKLMDIDDEEEARAMWKKMYQNAPEGRFIHLSYARSIEDDKDRIAEMENLKNQIENSDGNPAHVYNFLAYQYYAQGDKEKAKKYFEKYIELYPEGYNPYDSMGDYYRNEGDMDMALTYYRKALGKFWGATGTQRKVREIEAEMGSGEKAEKSD